MWNARRILMCELVPCKRRNISFLVVISRCGLWMQRTPRLGTSIPSTRASWDGSVNAYVFFYDMQLFNVCNEISAVRTFLMGYLKDNFDDIITKNGVVLSFYSGWTMNWLQKLLYVSFSLKKRKDFDTISVAIRRINLKFLWWKRT